MFKRFIFFILLTLIPFVSYAQNLSGSEIGYELPPVGTYPVTFEEAVTISSDLTVSGNTLLIGTVGIGSSPPVGDKLYVAGDTGISGNLTVGGTATFSSDVTLSGSTTNLYLEGSIDGDLIPLLDDTYDVGKYNDKEWRDIAVGRTAYVDDAATDNTFVSTGTSPGASDSLDVNLYSQVANKYIRFNARDADPDLEIVADTGITGDLTVSGTTTISSDLTLSGTTSDLYLEGGDVRNVDQILVGPDTSGVLTLGSIGGTNNEKLTIDTESISNNIIFSTTTAADIYNFMGWIRLGQLDRAFRFGATGNEARLGFSSVGNDNLQLGVAVASATASGYFSLMEVADMGNANRSPTASSVFGTTSANPVLADYSSDATQAGDMWGLTHDQDDTRFRGGNGRVIIDTIANNDSLIIENNGAVAIGSDLTVGSTSLYVNSTLDRVGINNPAPTTTLDVTGDATISSDLTLSGTGTGTLVFSDGVWNELPPTPVTASKLGSTAPTLTPFLGAIEQYTFDASNDYIIGATEVTHGYKEGTDIYAHVHWATNGIEGTDAGVNWQLTYSIANYGWNVFSASDTLSTDDTIPANTGDRAHRFTGLGAITGTDVKIGAYIVWRLERIASGIAAPSADPFGIAIGFHCQFDTVGSRSELTK